LRQLHGNNGKAKERRMPVIMTGANAITLLYTTTDTSVTATARLLLLVALVVMVTEQWQCYVL